MGWCELVSKHGRCACSTNGGSSGTYSSICLWCHMSFYASTATGPAARLLLWCQVCSILSMMVLVWFTALVVSVCLCTARKQLDLFLSLPSYPTWPPCRPWLCVQLTSWARCCCAALLSPVGCWCCLSCSFQHHTLHGCVCTAAAVWLCCAVLNTRSCVCVVEVCAVIPVKKGPAVHMLVQNAPCWLTDWVCAVACLGSAICSA